VEQIPFYKPLNKFHVVLFLKMSFVSLSQDLIPHSLH
jgi:hypothetical protein